jgi:hypothetical protein
MLLSILPLTQLLLKGDVAWNGNFNRDADPQTEILLTGIMRNDISIKELFDKYISGNVEVTIDATYMFGKLCSTDFCISHPQGGTKTSKLKYQTKPRVQKILWKHTRWFPLLKLQVRNALLNLITVDGNKNLNFCKFRRVLEAVDHICTGLFLSGERQSVINRVQVALISNMVVTGEKGYFTYLKAYKSLVKGLRKAVLSAAPIPEIQPCFHWIKGTAFWSRFNHVVSNPTTGWEELQHVLVVLQTRSTGLANDQWVQDSLVKWIKVTSNSESNYTTTFIQEGSKSLAVKVKDSGIVSLTSASCVESSRSNGGKFSLIKSILDEIRRFGVRLVDWNTGELSQEVSKLPDNISITEDWGEGIEPYISQDIGYYLFSYALGKFYESYDSSKINLSAVIEQGKARVVTPNSIILYLLTMPLSHATLRCFEAIPELNIGVSKTNDAWEFWKRMRPSTLNDDGTYSQSFICADLETATDYSPFELVSTTLDVMKDLGLQSWYVDVAKKLLSNPRWYLFSPKKSVHRTSRGALMADPGTKSVLTLSHYLIIKSIEQDLNVNLCFAIKGDDVVIQAPTADVERIMTLYRIRMSKSGFVLSEDDTFISNKYAFYCEGVFRNYHLTSESPSSWNSLVNTSDPSYCDIPTVKLAFPVFKNNYRIGETPEGKISLLSKRRSYFRDGSFARFQYELLDLIQVVTFRLSDYDIRFLFGAKWKGGLSKPITPLTKGLLVISDDEKKDLILDYSFIISKVFKEKVPKRLRMPQDVLKAYAKRTNRFYLRQDNDDENVGEYKMIDFKINLPELWSSQDELEWGLSLGPTLLTITGISTDKSIKSKIVTLHSLSGTDLNIERRITQQSIDDDCIIDQFKRSINVEDFEEFYNWYQRIRTEQYPYVNWSLHLEKDFPLYNAMKVNPRDYQDTNLEEGIRNIICRKDDIKTHPEILDSLGDQGLTRKQLLALRLALQLHGKANKPGEIDDRAYEEAIEATTDFDQQVVFKLARMYNKIAEIIRVTASTGISIDELRKHLRKEIPHNFILWFSADRERFKILEEMNLKYLNDLDVDNNLRWLFKIYIARYVPVGSMTPYGYMIEKYIRQDGHIPLVPEELTDDDLYGDYFDDTVGFDFDNIESIAQSVREGTQREVNNVVLQGPRTELGYHIVEDIPGLLTS